MFQSNHQRAMRAMNANVKAGMSVVEAAEKACEWFKRVGIKPEHLVSEYEFKAAKKAAKKGVLKAVGICGACGAQFKVKKGRMVHHGFKRPGDGMIHGDCFGVGYLCYELSAEVCVVLKKALEEMLVGAEARVAQFQAGEVKSLWVKEGYSRNAKLVEIFADGGWKWLQEVRIAQVNAEGKVRYLKSDIARMEKMISGWELKEVRMVEEA